MDADCRNLGERLLQAAKMAAALHLNLIDKLEFGRNAPLGLAAAGLVKDDLSSAAIDLRGHSPASPWIQAGEDPAGSF